MSLADGEVLNLYKPSGYTPLQALKELKRKIPKYKDSKASYAGKLDPIAEGVLPVLIGHEVNNQQDYQNLDKEYIADILIGFSTDTYDILGMVENIKPESNIGKPKLEDEILSWVGSHDLEIPVYSSYEIKSRPLFNWAREGRLDEIDIPKKEMVIYKAILLDFKSKESNILLEEISDKISVVEGDFRQKQILKKWRSVLSENGGKYKIARIKFQCSSGTYIRSLVNEIGTDLDVPMVLFGLTRTKVGGIRGDLADTDYFWAGDSIRLDCL